MRPIIYGSFKITWIFFFHIDFLLESIGVGFLIKARQRDLDSSNVLYKIDAGRWLWNLWHFIYKKEYRQLQRGEFFIDFVALFELGLSYCMKWLDINNQLVEWQCNLSLNWTSHSHEDIKTGSTRNQWANKRSFLLGHLKTGLCLPTSLIKMLRK